MLKLFSLFKNPAPSRLRSVGRSVRGWKSSRVPLTLLNREREKELNFPGILVPPPSPLKYFWILLKGDSDPVLIILEDGFPPIFLLFFLNGRNQLNVERCRAIQMDSDICCLHLNQFWMPIVNSFVASFFSGKSWNFFPSVSLVVPKEENFFLSFSLSPPEPAWLLGKFQQDLCVSGPNQTPPSPLPVLNYLMDGRCVVLSQPLQTKVSYCYLLSRSSSGVENLTRIIKEQIPDEKSLRSLCSTAWPS